MFKSNKNVDSSHDIALQAAFARNKVDTYLDVLDSSINGGGRELTEHIKQNLNSCSDILVVMSQATKDSWWVPFEIGMSAQVDMPTASFLKSDVVLPSYLSYWPRLKTTTDVDKYVAVRKRVEQQMKQRCDSYTQANRRVAETRAFYEALKIELR